MSKFEIPISRRQKSKSQAALAGLTVHLLLELYRGLTRKEGSSEEANSNRLPPLKVLLLTAVPLTVGAIVAWRMDHDFAQWVGMGAIAFWFLVIMKLSVMEAKMKSRQAQARDVTEKHASDTGGGAGDGVPTQISTITQIGGGVVSASSSSTLVATLCCPLCKTESVSQELKLLAPFQDGHLVECPQCQEAVPLALPKKTAA